MMLIASPCIIVNHQTVLSPRRLARRKFSRLVYAHHQDHILQPTLVQHHRLSQRKILVKHKFSFDLDKYSFQDEIHQRRKQYKADLKKSINEVQSNKISHTLKPFTFQIERIQINNFKSLGSTYPKFSKTPKGYLKKLKYLFLRIQSQFIVNYFMKRFQISVTIS